MRTSQTAASVFALAFMALLSSLTLANEDQDRDKRHRRPSVCVVPFEASVRQGPSAGLALQGVLTLQVESDGRIDTGAFALADGSTIPVVGQAHGRAINLFLDLGDGTFIAGVGTAQYAIRECRGRARAPIDAGNPIADTRKVGDYRY
jgi:hypothetical protein